MEGKHFKAFLTSTNGQFYLYALTSRAAVLYTRCFVLHVFSAAALAFVSLVEALMAFIETLVYLAAAGVARAADHHACISLQCLFQPRQQHNNCQP